MEKGYEDEYAKAITSYLALNFNKMVSKLNNLARWNFIGGKTEYLFSRQAFPMLWDYSEINPLSDTAGSWNKYQEYSLEALESCTNFDLLFPQNEQNYAYVSQASAMQLPYNDNFFDMIFTDPPYYDNVPYSGL